MNRLKPLLASAILLLAATACGQKGPLFLPQDTPQAEEHPAETGDEADEKDS